MLKYKPFNTVKNENGFKCILKSTFCFLILNMLTKPKYCLI